MIEKEEILLRRLIELIVPERSIAEDINAEEVERLTDGLIDLGDELNDRSRRNDSGDLFDLEEDLF